MKTFSQMGWCSAGQAGELGGPWAAATVLLSEMCVNPTPPVRKPTVKGMSCEGGRWARTPSSVTQLRTAWRPPASEVSRRLVTAVVKSWEGGPGLTHPSQPALGPFPAASPASRIPACAPGAGVAMLAGLCLSPSRLRDAWCVGLGSMSSHGPLAGQWAALPGCVWGSGGVSLVVVRQVGAHRVLGSGALWIVTLWTPVSHVPCAQAWMEPFPPLLISSSKPCAYPSIRLSTCCLPSVHPPELHPPTRPPTHLPIHPSIHPSTHPCIHSCTHGRVGAWKGQGY